MGEISLNVKYFKKDIGSELPDIFNPLKINLYGSLKNDHTGLHGSVPKVKNHTFVLLIQAFEHE